MAIRKDDQTKGVNIFDVAEGEVLQASLSSMDLEAAQIYDYLKVTHEDIEAAREIAASLPIQDAIRILERYIDNHGDDMCIPSETVAAIRSVFEMLVAEKEADDRSKDIGRMCAAILHNNSVYQEVRAIIKPEDNPDEPVNTIRMWVIGLIFAGGLASCNEFFAPRQPAITIPAYLAQLFGFLLGKVSATVLPTTVFFPGSRFAFTLNPGPWGLKEQTLVTIMANVSYVSPLITELFFFQRLPMYLHQPWASNFGYGICIMLSTQLLGYGLAGVCRRFLVYPSSLIWFFTLSQTSMNRAFVENQNVIAGNWKISRFKYFFIVFACAWCYSWIPNTMFPTMTFFNWITWIRPSSAVIAIITGTYYYNLGFNPLPSLDYQWFSFIDPFVTPFFVLTQIVCAVGLWGLLVIIPVFFTNTNYTGYLPINSWFPYDNTGNIYDMSLILDHDHKFNQTAYAQHSPVFLPATYMLRYAGMFTILPALFVFTYLWYRPMLTHIFKNMFKKVSANIWEDDVHYRLMSKYKEVPDWVYFGIALVAMALGLISVYVWPVGVPGWIYPVAFFSSALFAIPVGVLLAVTGYQTDLEILFNIIGGAAVKGDPVSTYIFKVLGKSILFQGMYFISDMKLCHYAKVPPRIMVATQVAATLVASIASLSIINYQISQVPGICNLEVQDRWICSNVSAAWTSAIVWGALGPARIFSSTSMFNKLPLGILAGALWPLPWYFARKRWPNSVLRVCHPVVMLIAPILWAPLNFSNLFPALPISFIFGFWIKTHYADWWSKYNYVTSTALITGIAFSVIIQFAGLTNRGVEFPSWWGTTKYTSTCDLQDCRWLTVAEGETFGPTEWH